MYIFDERDPRPLLEAMYQVDHLIDMCERQREVAWAHLESDPVDEIERMGADLGRPTDAELAEPPFDGEWMDFE